MASSCMYGGWSIVRRDFSVSHTEEVDNLLYGVSVYEKSGETSVVCCCFNKPCVSRYSITV